MAQTKKATNQDRAYDALEAIGVKAQHRAADVNVGTLEYRDIDPFEVIGVEGAADAVQALKLAGRFSRVTNESEVRDLESKHFERIDDPRVRMRGCAGGILMWRSNEHHEIYQQRRRQRALRRQHGGNVTDINQLVGANASGKLTTKTGYGPGPSYKVDGAGRRI